MRKTLGISILIAVIVTVVAYSQTQLPPSIDLGIQNVQQETPYWCWAAVSQQIIAKLKGPQNTPSQCALVAIAYGYPPQACLSNPQQFAQLLGALQQIQGLIYGFGGRISAIAAPANPLVLYQALSQGSAIIMAVKTSPYAGHVIVITGMDWVPTPFGPEAVLHINDPMSFFTQPIPFQNILPYWNAAIVVYGVRS